MDLPLSVPANTVIQGPQRWTVRPNQATKAVILLRDENDKPAAIERNPSSSMPALRRLTYIRRLSWLRIRICFRCERCTAAGAPAAGGPMSRRPSRKQSIAVAGASTGLVEVLIGDKKSTMGTVNSVVQGGKPPAYGAWSSCPPGRGAFGRRQSEHLHLRVLRVPRQS